MVTLDEKHGSSDSSQRESRPTSSDAHAADSGRRLNPGPLFVAVPATAHLSTLTNRSLPLNFLSLCWTRVYVRKDRKMLVNSKLAIIVSFDYLLIRDDINLK